MNNSFTAEQVRLLAEAERMMDAGEIPYVAWHGNRLSVQPLVMDELGLEAGQTVSDEIAQAIMEAHLASCQAQLALAKSTETPPTTDKGE